MMRAIVVRAFGPPDVLVQREVDDPEPAAGQVVVAVAVAGVNFIETRVRAGQMPAPPGVEPPFVLGNEIGGTVIRLGAGVSPDVLGQRVIASLNGTGGYADQVALAADALIPVPGDLGIEQAVALLAHGRTAVGLLREARIAAGDSVLIEAAGGGVGSLLVQLARQAGAGTIVAAAHGQRKLELARGLGADVAIDYEQPDWGARVREALGADGVDVLFESVGGAIGRAAFELLANGRGRCIVFGFSSGRGIDLTSTEILRRGLSVTGYGGRALRPGWAAHARELVEEALRLAADGRLVPTIGQTFPLERADEAHAAVESRATIGKTLLLP
jgi:NADPH2:quinone reductase